MTTPKVKTISVGPDKDRWYVLESDPSQPSAPSVSSIVDMLPKKALTPWAAKMAAFFVVDNLDAVTSLIRTDKDAAIDLIKGSPFRKVRRAGDNGTLQHGLTEEIARAVFEGRKPKFAVPPGSMPYLKNYARFMKEFNVRPVLIETSVWNDEPAFAGTFDLLAWLTIDGKDVLSIVDTKTAESGVWPSSAIQQTGYRWAKWYIDPDSGELKDMPKVEQTFGLWLRPHGFALIPLESGPREWEAFKHLHASYMWKLEREKVVVGRALNDNPIKRKWKPPNAR